jgi:uncharacterized RmlC-like cupin family protein
MARNPRPYHGGRRRPCRINARADEALDCVVVRSDGEAVVVNLDIEPVEKPENVQWIDPLHRS